MRYLLDSHIIFRAAITPGELAPRHREIIQSPGNVIYVSVVSLWELVIKRSIGKLKFMDDFLMDIAGSGYQLLPVGVSDLLAYSKLALYHKDPFDRMLVAQAQAQGLALVSEDRQMHLYLDVISLIR